MELRMLGRTGLHVSQIGLGNVTWGVQNTEAEGHAQMDAAYAAGVNFFDTAEMYPVPPQASTQGLTESIIGRWFAKTGLRQRIVLGTKVSGPGDQPYLRGGPLLDRAQVTAACEASLQRLGTDYIDLYQVHWPQRMTNCFGQFGYTPTPGESGPAIEETLEALHDLVRAGKVRHIGLSNETAWGVARYLGLSERHGWPRVAAIQNPYSLLNRGFEIALAEFAHREAVGLLAYSPLGFGKLSGKYSGGSQPDGARLTLFPQFQRYSNPQADAATAEYVQLARTHGLEPAAMALAFVHSRAFVTSTLISATSPAQLASNLASVQLKLDADVLQGIEAIRRRYPIPSP